MPPKWNRLAGVDPAYKNTVFRRLTERWGKVWVVRRRL